jgi:hypothetical protein
MTQLQQLPIGIEPALQLLWLDAPGILQEAFALKAWHC